MEAAAFYPEVKDIGFSLPDAARVFIMRMLPEYRQKLETAFPGAKVKHIYAIWAWQK